MKETTWKVAKKAPKEHIESFSEYHAVLIQLLFNRGITSQEAVDAFFNPDFEQDLHDPYLMIDMKRAVKRILTAVKKKEKVAIYGDYDADGVTSASILTDVFKALGLSGLVYLPDREKDGYGLNNNAIDWLHERKIELIVTSDCGVSNKKQIDYANSLGIEVVVFDHHTVPEDFSDKYIIVNPKRKDDPYPFKELCAAGVVFKFAEALYRYEQDSLKVTNKEAFLKWLMDLVAIGTVADCMPLLDENRTLVTYGLKVLQKTKRIGLQEMMMQAKITGDLDSYHIGFILAPRINAAGRIDHANAGYKLINARTQKDAEGYTLALEKTNKERQKISEDIFNQAVHKVGDTYLDKKIVIVSGANWPGGVLGIVAGKLTQKYFRPVIVIGEHGDMWGGSGRGPECFSLVDAISNSKKLLEAFGGHKQAAGLSLPKENYETFKREIEEFAEKNLTEKDLVQKIDVDLELKLDEVDWKIYDEVIKMGPFGESNSEPLFVIKNVKLKSKKRVGATEKHLKCEFDNCSGKTIGGIGFNLGEISESIGRGDSVDILVALSVNEWKGKRELQLRVTDIKPS